MACTVCDFIKSDLTQANDGDRCVAYVNWQLCFLFGQLSPTAVLVDHASRLEPVYHTEWQIKYLTSYCFVGGTSEGSEWYQIDSR